MEKKFDISNYKVGMKLRCLKGHLDFMVGNIYTVNTVRNGRVYVKDDGDFNWYFDGKDNDFNLDSFEIIKNEEPKKYKVGDKLICISECKFGGLSTYEVGKIYVITEVKSDSVRLENDMFFGTDYTNGYLYNINDSFKKVEEPKFTTFACSEELLKLPRLEISDKTKETIKMGAYGDIISAMAESYIIPPTQKEDKIISYNITDKTPYEMVAMVCKDLGITRESTGVYCVKYLQEKGYIKKILRYDKNILTVEFNEESQKKEKTTTMENKVTDEEILAPLGVEYLYNNAFRQTKLLVVTEETYYEEWVKEDILILEEIPHYLSYDKVLELINVRVNNEFIKVQDRLARIRVKNELAQQEKEAKEERRKIYLKGKKEFGKKENK